MDLVGTRVAALFALFALTMLAGLVPVLVFGLTQRKRKSTILENSSESFQSANHLQDTKSSNTSNKILQLLLVFGGGVLLATCFVHMIPEIQENYDAYLENQESHDEDPVTTLSSSDTETNVTDFPLKGDEGITNLDSSVYHHPVHSTESGEKEGHSHKVPWVEICICLGIFLTYFIEESILLLIGRDSSHHHHHHHPNHHDNSAHDDHQIREDAGYSRKHSSPLGSGDYGSISNKNGSRGFSETNKYIESGFKNGHDNVAVDLRGDELSPTSLYRSQHSNGTMASMAKESFWTLFLRGLVIVIAFLAHSIFDGVAIGLQTTPYSIWTMFFAICLHKLVVVFAIGFELFEKTGSLVLTSIHMTIFAAMSPFGIFLTIVIEEGISEDGSLTLILLNAVATGAILYIVFLEILQADRCPEINGLIQLVALVAGFTLMTCMTVLVSDGD